MALCGVILLAIAFSPLLQRLMKSVWLITQVSPYAQTGTGEGLILVYGDSTAYGTGATAATDSIAGRLGAAYPAFGVSTVAKNGQLIAEVIPRLVTQTAKADVLLLQIGGNDILQYRTPEQIERDTRALLAVAITKAEHVAFMSSGNVGAAAYFVKHGQPDPALEALTRTAREIFIRVSNEYGVMYVDLFEEPANDLFLREPDTYLALDGLHPSSAGYALWYQKLAPVVASVLP